MNEVMKTITNYLLLAFLSIVTLTCSEDPVESIAKGTLTGTVVEDGTNIPLENVKISTNPNSSTVFTNAEGNFMLEEILVGQYSVQAELDGYLAAFESAEILRESTTNVIFEMQIETANNLPPVTPVLISPSDNANDVSLETELVWSGSDPEGDDITYTIELRNDLDDELLTFETLNDTTLVVSNLRFGLKYFWQVGAKDDVNEDMVLSQISSFETIDSPDNRFVFVRRIDGNNVIFSSDESGNEVQLTESTANSFRPRRNVAANRIAYLSNNGAETHIFTMNLDGSNKQQITSAVAVNGFNLDEIDFSWTEDGGQLYYSNFDQLFSINADGTDLQLVYKTVDGKFITEVVISADESFIALKTNTVNGYEVSIFTIDPSGVVIDEVLNNVQGAAGGLDISVDNSKILYWYDVSEFQIDNYRQLDSRVFIYERASSTAFDISDEKLNGTNDYDCRFSPNEAQVILTNTSNDGISQKNIVLVAINDDNTSGERLEIIQNGEMSDYE